MVRKIVIIIVTVVALLVMAGIGVLVWWLIRAQDTYDYETIQLEGDGIGDVKFTAAFTRFPRRGDMFWWFYPAQVENSTSKPILLWLDGVTGVPPSFLANFAMFGPYDVHLNKRESSWVNDYNLLFIDAPLGTGFSTLIASEYNLPGLDENVEHLMYAMKSFYELHSEYKNTTLYIFGQADGSQLAIPAAIEMIKDEEMSNNLKGIFLGNAIVSPALALTKLGFYLDEWGYIDGAGRRAVEEYSNLTTTLLNMGNLEEAFVLFTSLGYFINENAGAVAINLGHIVEKMTKDEDARVHRDFFSHKSYLRSAYPDIDMYTFMQDIVSPTLGITGDVKYDGGRDSAVEAFKGIYMEPVVGKVEELLENSTINVTIYNGNLDAVSNTPGQLEWVNNLQWSGQSDFLSRPRIPFVFRSHIEGYIREAARLQFYWINVAGQWVPLDNPAVMKRMIDRATLTTRA